MQVTETLSEGLKRASRWCCRPRTSNHAAPSGLTTSARRCACRASARARCRCRSYSQRYGTAVTAEVLEESVTEATQQVLSERGLRPAQQPKVDLVTENPAADGEDLEFKVELELLPDITLPDFGTIELTRLQGGSRRRTRWTRRWREIAKRNRELEPIPAEDAGEPRTRRDAGEVLTVDFVGQDRRRASSRAAPAPMSQVEIGGDGLHPRLRRAARGHAAGRNPDDQRHLPGGLWQRRPGRQGGDVRHHRQEAQPRRSIPAAGRRAGEEDWASTIWTRCGRSSRSRHAAGIRRHVPHAAEDGSCSMPWPRWPTSPSPEGMVDAEFERIWQRLEADSQGGTGWTTKTRKRTRRR